MTSTTKITTKGNNLTLHAFRRTRNLSKFMSSLLHKRKHDKFTNEEEDDDAREQQHDDEVFEDDDAGETTADVGTTGDLSKYRVVKRTAHHAHTKKNELYVSRRSKRASQLARARKLLFGLENSVDEVVVYGLGAARNRAMDLALTLVETYNGLSSSATTGSITVVDDFEPLEEGLPVMSRTRQSKFVRIVVRKNKQGSTGSEEPKLKKFLVSGDNDDGNDGPPLS